MKSVSLLSISLHPSIHPSRLGAGVHTVYIYAVLEIWSVLHGLTRLGSCAALERFNAIFEDGFFPYPYVGTYQNHPFGWLLLLDRFSCRGKHV